MYAASRYDPYGRVLTEEQYDHMGMRRARRAAIEAARTARHWGLVLGTLGRQGNPRILNHIQEVLNEKGFSYNVVNPSRLDFLPASPG
jgi:2-(3-amino-3-carboxypropyl)histidine synthase